jgi:hypothetical protein
MAWDIGYPNEKVSRQSPAVDSAADNEVIDSEDGALYKVPLPKDVLPMALNMWHGNVLRATTEGSPLFAPAIS